MRYTPIETRPSRFGAVVIDLAGLSPYAAVTRTLEVLERFTVYDFTDVEYDSKCEVARFNVKERKVRDV